MPMLKTRFFLSLLLVALCGLSASGLMAQSSEGAAWEPMDPTGLIKELDPELMNVPGRYLVVRVPEGTFHIQALEMWFNGSEAEQNNELERVFKNNREYWPGTQTTRRYKTEQMAAYLKKHLGTKSTLLRYSIKLKGAKLAREVKSVSMADLTIAAFPQTWENIWQREVAHVPHTERVERVKAFDREFREVIENVDTKAEWFSRAEQNAYAQFYQSQFNYQRNAAPNDPAIYHELAAYHEERANIDAKIGVYLDAVRHKFESEEHELFHLLIGQTMIERLRLYQDAIPHLEKASSYGLGRLLLMRAHLELGNNEEAVAVAKQISADTLETLVYREDLDDKDAIKRQVKMLEARAQVAEHKLGSALEAFKDVIAGESEEADEASWMLASLYVYRAEAGDYANATSAIQSRVRFQELLRNARTPVEKRDEEGIPYDPLGAQALTVWADAQIDGALDSGTKRSPNLADLNLVLDYAAALDPLSATPFFVHGKAREALEDWAEAEKAYLHGLTIEPNHLALNFRLGVLYLQGERLESASEHLRATLRVEPDFYQAMNLLADVAVKRAARELREMERTIASGEGELSGFIRNRQEFLQQASIFLSNSLAVEDRQSSVRVSLADLYTRMADAEESELATSYLNRARVLSARARRTLASVLGQAPSTPSRHKIASAPPVEAHLIYAYATYQLGTMRHNQAAEAASGSAEQGIAFHDAERLFGEAIEALNFLKDTDTSRHHLLRTGEKDFVKSEVYLWAKKWRTRMIVNQRRSRQGTDFRWVKTTEDFAKIENLGEGWGVPAGDTIDEGVKGNCEVAMGTLTIGMDTQAQENYISRISRVEENNRLASFEVTIPKLGSSEADRGIHLSLTKKPKGRNNNALRPALTLMLGVDANYRLFWELRSLKDESKNSPEAAMEFGRGESLLLNLERKYLDMQAIGTLDAETKNLKLGIARFFEETSKAASYTLLVNGIEFPIDLSSKSGALSNNGRTQAKQLYSKSSMKRQSTITALIGVWVRGLEGESGSLTISDAKWIYDSNLAWDKEEE